MRKKRWKLMEQKRILQVGRLADKLMNTKTEAGYIDKLQMKYILQ